MMKLDKKDTIFGVLMVIIVIAIAVIITSGKSNNTALISPSPTPTPTPIPSGTMLINATATPKPKLLVKEANNYQALVDELNPKNRVIRVYDECGYLLPSNVAYKNNTVIMLDNTGSAKAHILTIGGKEYALNAGDWILTTLSSPAIPVTMKIFCENVEMGAIELD